MCEYVGEVVKDDETMRNAERSVNSFSCLTVVIRCTEVENMGIIENFMFSLISTVWYLMIMITHVLQS